MELEEIKNTIEKYNKLWELAESKIKILAAINRHYSTSRGIEEISFGDDEVFVVCDGTSFFDKKSFLD